MSTTQPVQTPAGTLQWVVHSGDGKPDLSGKLKYSADIVLASDSKECKQLKDTIDAFWKAEKPNGFKKLPKSLGYKVEKAKILDSDDNEQYDENGEFLKEKTGNTVFTFRTNTTYPSGDMKTVDIFNARGRKVDLASKKIANGSVGNIGGAMGIYRVSSKNGTLQNAGVSLYLNSIRLLEFKEYRVEDEWDDSGDENGWTGDDAELAEWNSDAPPHL